MIVLPCLCLGTLLHNDSTAGETRLQVSLERVVLPVGTILSLIAGSWH